MAFMYNMLIASCQHFREKTCQSVALEVVFHGARVLEKSYSPGGRSSPIVLIHCLFFFFFFFFFLKILDRSRSYVLSVIYF